MLLSDVRTELDAAILQALVNLGLAVLFGFLYRRHRKPYFAWWTIAWGMYVLQAGAISTFLATENRIWLYWHQVVIGWTALVLLWAALLFSQQVRWRSRFLWLVLFPPVWSYVAIYRMDNFFMAAAPAVAFLSLATFWTGVVFFRFRGGGIPERHAAALGSASPGLPAAAGPGRVEPVGLLPGYALRAGHGWWSPAAGDRGSPPRAGHAVRPVR
jgi:hypothetical protein